VTKQVPEAYTHTVTGVSESGGDGQEAVFCVVIANLMKQKESEMVNIGVIFV
jgi:hypothetical protein